MDAASPGGCAGSPDLGQREFDRTHQSANQRELEEHITSLTETVRTLALENQQIAAQFKEEIVSLKAKNQQRAVQIEEQMVSLNEAITMTKNKKELHTMLIRDLDAQVISLNEAMGMMKAEQQQDSARIQQLEEILAKQSSSSDVTERASSRPSQQLRKVEKSKPKEPGSGRRSSAPGPSLTRHEPSRKRMRSQEPQEQQSSELKVVHTASTSRRAVSDHGLTRKNDTVRPAAHPQIRVTRLSPDTYLGMVTTIDMREQAQHLLTQRPSDSEVAIFKSVMANKKGKALRTYEYVVRMGGSEPHLGARYLFPDWMDRYKDEVFTPKEGLELTVMEMSTAISEMGTSNARGPTTTRSGIGRCSRPLPRFVLEIGELKIRTHYHNNGQREVRSTNCHVVMDMKHPDKPLWLVYRYRGVEGGQKIKQNRKFERDDDMFHFVESNKGFDIALIAESIQDWLHQDRNFRPVQNSEGLIKSTCLTVNPFFSRPLCDDFFGQRYDSSD